jgi:HAD superfamily hydrolase (TIGR01549 family)
MENIEKIVFDLDNTLIIWGKDYTSALRKTMKEFNIVYDYMKIDQVIEKQNYIREYMDKNLLLNDINTACQLNLDITFIDRFLENQMELAIDNDYDLIETINYLSNKYELVLLTNWYTDTQIGRLKKAGIDKHFKNFFGGDIVNVKPHTSGFIKAAGNTDYNRCVMIGDSFYFDIEPAINLGMKVIQIDYKNVINDEKEYPVIKNIKELMDIL